MSETPRTDAALIDWADFCDEGRGSSPYVRADFTRTLKRENAALAAEVEELRNDKERLDWMEANYGKPLSPEQFETVDSRIRNSSVRTAIDAARLAEGGKL